MKYLTKAFNTIEFQLEVKCKWCYENIKLHLTLKFEHCTIIWCLKSFSAAPLNYFSILKSFKARLFLRLHVGGQDFFSPNHHSFTVFPHIVSALE